MDPTTLTAARILGIADDEPERLFSRPDLVKEQYRALVKRWHPDNPAHSGSTTAESVFKHINALHALALARIEKGEWRTPGFCEFTGIDGKGYRIRYLVKRKLDLGEMYIGTKIVAFVIDTAFRDAFNVARRTIGTLHFADDKMRAEFAPRLPVIEGLIETADKLVMVIKKTDELVLLRDALTFFGGKIDPKHVAWITSELHNLACYLEWAKLTHNDISPDTVFISPPLHSVCLLGGWWFAAAEQDSLEGRLLPARTANNAPPDVLTTKRASKRTDLELVRLTGREMLGNAAAVRASADVPSYLAEWLTLPSSGKAKTDYKNWQTVLSDSFGRRRFTALSLTPSDVYKE